GSQKAHCRGCLCQAVLVEVHHIVPQAEWGSDEEDNAAPLCASCHEIYGANPTKRKFIREARDWWYETCAKRYAPGSDALADVVEAASAMRSRRWGDTSCRTPVERSSLGGERRPA